MSQPRALLAAQAAVSFCAWRDLFVGGLFRRGAQGRQFLLEDVRGGHGQEGAGAAGAIHDAFAGLRVEHLHRHFGDIERRGIAALAAVHHAAGDRTEGTGTVTGLGFAQGITGQLHDHAGSLVGLQRQIPAASQQVRLPGLGGGNGFVDALGNRLLACLGERLVALDPELALAGRPGLVIDLGQHQHRQLLEGILVVEAQVTVQVLAAAQQGIFQVLCLGTDLNDTAGAIEIGRALHPAPARRLAAWTEPQNGCARPGTGTPPVRWSTCPASRPESAPAAL